MMWTQEKSKITEHLVELKKIYAKYNKIVSIIKSCTNMNHIECCYKIVGNFEQYCDFKRLPQPKLNNRLRNYIKLKKISIRLT